MALLPACSRMQLRRARGVTELVGFIFRLAVWMECVELQEAPIYICRPVHMLKLCGLHSRFVLLTGEARDKMGERRTKRKR